VEGGGVGDGVGIGVGGGVGIRIGVGVRVGSGIDVVDINVSAGDELKVDMGSGLITNLTKNETYQAGAVPEFMQNLIKAGGLMESVRQKIGT